MLTYMSCIYVLHVDIYTLHVDIFILHVKYKNNWHVGAETCNHTFISISMIKVSNGRS